MEAVADKPDWEHGPFELTRKKRNRAPSALALGLALVVFAALVGARGCALAGEPTFEARPAWAWVAAR
jgi:hypothetical protein